LVFSLVFYGFKYAQFQWNVQIQERFFRIKTRKYKKEKIILLIENKTVYLQIEIYIEQLQQRFLKKNQQSKTKNLAM